MSVVAARFCLSGRKTDTSELVWLGLDTNVQGAAGTLGWQAATHGHQLSQDWKRQKNQGNRGTRSLPSLVVRWRGEGRGVKGGEERKKEWKDGGKKRWGEGGRK